MSRTISAVIVIFLFAAASQEKKDVKFSCQGRAGGYYADVDAGCQIYHMCDGLGRQFSYSCPNTTLFQQRMLICDHWYMVNCSRSEIDYTANLLIGQNKPFVEDSDKQTYYRTPRPDLLTEPTASEINLIYRASRAQNRTDLNLVGVNSDFDQNNGSSIVTDKPAYHLPSHWSTEYFKSTPPTTVGEIDVNVNEPVVNVNKGLISNRESVSQPTDTFRRTNVVVPIPVAKSINFNSNNLDNSVKLKPTNSLLKKDFVVNYKSSFKATTPVFPTKDELLTTESPIDHILNAPATNTHQPAVINRNDKPEITVNFNSLFKATTPVFPTIEELGTTEKSLNDILKPPRSNAESAAKQDTNIHISPNRNGESVADQETTVNFKSLFKATTPVYPTKEELGTTEAPVDDILQPPGSSADFPDLDIQPPSFLFEAPALGTEQSSTEENKYISKNLKGKIKIATRLNNEKVLKELRKMFSIPDYEFPLDTITRPGYEHNIDSLNANPFLADVVPRQHA